MSDDIRELVAGIRTLSSTLIHNSNNSSMNTTHNNSSRRHQLSISVLNDIDTFDGKQGHKLRRLACRRGECSSDRRRRGCSSKRKSQGTSTRPHKRTQEPTLAPHQRTTSQPPK